jgi:hypothetical protein
VKIERFYQYSVYLCQGGEYFGWEADAQEYSRKMNYKNPVERVQRPDDLKLSGKYFNGCAIMVRNLKRNHYEKKNLENR